MQMVCNNQDQSSLPAQQREKVPQFGLIFGIQMRARLVQQKNWRCLSNGSRDQLGAATLANVSYVDFHYRPALAPVVFEL